MGHLPTLAEIMEMRSKLLFEQLKYRKDELNAETDPDRKLKLREIHALEDIALAKESTVRATRNFFGL
jgi:hypothetical protein